MKKKHILLATLLRGISVMAMDHAKEMHLGKEASRKEEVIRVKICLTDSAHSDTHHEVEIPVRLAKLIGALNNDLIEDPKTKDSIFPLPNMTLAEWQLIEPQLERVYGITHDEINAVQLRKEIIAEYVKLDAKSLIELIHVLDYADIPLLFEIACDEVKQRDLGRFNFEQINSLPGDMGNRIILDKILASCGAMPARELAVCRGHENLIRSVSVTHDGKIVSGSDDKSVRVWDMEGEELARCWGHEAPVYSVCVITDGKIVSGSDDRTVRVWNMQGNQRGHENEVNSLYVTHNGKIVSASDLTICVWDMLGNQVGICRGHESFIWSICVTKYGKIVSCSADKTVRVWDMQGTQLAVCSGHEGKVYSVCVTADGRIVSGSGDQTVRVWDMQGTQLAVCRSHDDPVYSICVTADGKIVSGTHQTVRVWDMQGKELAICRGHKGPVYSVCVTKDGKIVSGAQDRTVRVWDMDGKELAICRGYEDLVRSVCVTADGKIVSGAFDKIIRVWDVDGKELAVCRGHEDPVHSVCVTQDGAIVSGSADNTVRVWSIGLLGRIVQMDQDKARSLWELLQNISQKTEIGKQELWKKIEKILGEDAPVAQAKINNNNNE